MVEIFQVRKIQLDGGLDQWKADDYPLDTKPATPQSSDFTISLQRGSLAIEDDMIKLLFHSDIKLLDNRDKEEWLGISSSPTEYYSPDFLPRRGRILARTINFASLRFIPLDEMEADDYVVYVSRIDNNEGN